MKYNVQIYEDNQGMLMINVPDEIFQLQIYYQVMYKKMDRNYGQI